MDSMIAALEAAGVSTAFICVLIALYKLYQEKIKFKSSCSNVELKAEEPKAPDNV
jgi:hypothetical protein